MYRIKPLIFDHQLWQSIKEQREHSYLVEMSQLMKLELRPDLDTIQSDSTTRTSPTSSELIFFQQTAQQITSLIILILIKEEMQIPFLFMKMQNLSQQLQELLQTLFCRLELQMTHLDVAIYFAITDILCQDYLFF